MTTKNIIELDPIIQKMLENGLIRIKIIGHTDFIGSEKDNQILSLKRAKSVRDYLKKKGIKEDRMDIEGMGESEPLESNNDRGAKEINRRVVIKFYS